MYNLLQLRSNRGKSLQERLKHLIKAKHMNALFLEYAMDSLLDSVGSICDFFLASASEVGNRMMSLIGKQVQSFLLCTYQAQQGANDLLTGVVGMIFAPIGLAATFAAIPILALIWVVLFLMSAIAHSLTVPIVYIWYLYQKFKEAVSRPETIDYFPEPEEFQPEPNLCPPVFAMSAIAIIAGIGMDIEPVPSWEWSPSFLPQQEEVQAPIEITIDINNQVEIDIDIDVDTFRRELERQFAPQPHATWKDVVLEGLRLLEAAASESSTILVYPQCELNPNPDADLEIIQYAVRERVSPFPTPTASCNDEAERSLPLEVSTTLEFEFPAQPSNKVLQRWGKDQLVVFCDRINTIQKGSITKYRNASKTLLIKKIKAFYDA